MLCMAISIRICVIDEDTDDLCIAVSGTGAYACQLAKNVFGAGKVITTVSTAKVDKVAELLGEGVVDQSMYPSTSVQNLFFAALSFPNVVPD